MAVVSEQLQAYYLWLRERGLTYPQLRPVPVAAGLAGIHQQIHACKDCRLGHSHRRRALDTGLETAKLIFVGDGPLGHEELYTANERELLVKIVGALGLGEGDAYFAGALHCRMPDQAPPEQAVFEACRRHLIATINMLKCQAIVVLGSLATRALFGEQAVFAQLRGQVIFDGPLGKLPTIVSLHPRDLLRQPQAKRQAWAELQLIKQYLV